MDHSDSKPNRDVPDYMNDTPPISNSPSSDELAALRAIVEGTARHTGQEFFQSLVRHLAAAIGTRYAFVAEFAGGTMARTLAFWSRDRITDNIEWDMIGTPCEDVVRGNLCHYPAGVSQRFPGDKLSVGWSIESYLGVPLVDAQGRHLGHLAVFDERPMPDEPRKLFIFRIFAARAAAELERLQYEERLRESEQRWRSLTEEISRLNQELRSRVDEMQAILDIVPIGIGIAHDPDCRRITHNPYLSEVTGVPLGKNASFDAPPEERPDNHRILKDGKELPPDQMPMQIACRGVEVRDFEMDVVRADGGSRKLLCYVRPLKDAAGRIRGSVGGFLDITSRRQMEEELRQANARLELAVRGSNVGVWDLGLPDGDFNRRGRHYVNVWEQLGYDGPPAGRESALDEADQGDRAHLEERVRRYLAGETTEYETEIRLRHKDGSYRTMLARGAAARDATGKPLRFVGVIIDITKLKLVEEALRESEKRFRGTFENAAVGIAHVDAAGRFLRVNEKLCAIVGYPREELLQKSFQEITHPDDLAISMDAFTALPRDESPTYGLEKRYVRKDGSLVWRKCSSPSSGMQRGLRLITSRLSMISRSAGSWRRRSAPARNASASWPNPYRRKSSLPTPTETWIISTSHG
jgi:PAS domain S-box-containing protein